MPTELYFYQRQNEKEYAMKKSRLDRLNPDKTPKHLRKKMSEQEFFNDYLEGKNKMLGSMANMLNMLKISHQKAWPQ